MPLNRIGDTKRDTIIELFDLRYLKASACVSVILQKIFLPPNNFTTRLPKNNLKFTGELPILFSKKESFLSFKKFY